MKIENPTYEKLVPFLGRHVSLTANDEVHSGCLVVVTVTHHLFVGVDSPSTTWSNRSDVRGNLDANLCKFVGSKSTSVLWFDDSEFTDFIVHEPIKNFSPGNKWWRLGLPMLIGALRK